jgi:23S rRNA pseudouridine1911/1915/1917 synthase
MATDEFLYADSGETETRVAVFGAEDTGKRLDAALAEKFPDLSRSRIQALIESGDVEFLNSPEAVNKKTRLRPGDQATVFVQHRVPLTASAEDIPITVVFEDSDVIVVDKPRGMVVHPAHGNECGTLVNALLSHCALSGGGGAVRPGVVHRIDKNTSGLLVFAKNDRSHAALAAQFAEHSVNRRYLALVHGGFREDAGTVDAPIARKPGSRVKMAVVPNGRRAVTHWRVCERFGDAGYGGSGSVARIAGAPGGKLTLLELRLETGRTHQIRVHMEYIGRPVLGDDVYGGAKGDGQYLHAKALGFVHPSSGRMMEFDSALPEYFEKALKKLRG